MVSFSRIKLLFHCSQTSHQLTFSFCAFPAAGVQTVRGPCVQRPGVLKQQPLIFFFFFAILSPVLILKMKKRKKNYQPIRNKQKIYPKHQTLWHLWKVLTIAQLG
jgi:hypothetical protein